MNNQDLTFEEYFNLIEKRLKQELRNKFPSNLDRDTVLDDYESGVSVDLSVKLWVETYS